MQLTHSKEFHEPSIGYCEWDYLINQFEPRTVLPTSIIRDRPLATQLATMKLILGELKASLVRVTPTGTIMERIEEDEEDSVSLRPLKHIELLECFYVFENPVKVRLFLWVHTYLIDILFEAHRWIRKIFGTVNMHLEPHTDPEENVEELFIVIESPLSPKAALDLLDQLDNEWFLDIVDRTHGNLNVTVRCV